MPATVDPRKKSVLSGLVSSMQSERPAQIKRVARIKGQVEAVERMLKENRYCPEILQQIRAAHSALKALEASVLEAHLRGCVHKAFTAKDPVEAEKKMNELIQLMKV